MFDHCFVFTASQLVWDSFAELNPNWRLQLSAIFTSLWLVFTCGLYTVPFRSLLTLFQFFLILCLLPQTAFLFEFFPPNQNPTPIRCWYDSIFKSGRSLLSQFRISHLFVSFFSYMFLLWWTSKSRLETTHNQPKSLFYNACVKKTLIGLMIIMMMYKLSVIFKYTSFFLSGRKPAEAHQLLNQLSYEKAINPINLVFSSFSFSVRFFFF